MDIPARELAEACRVVSHGEVIGLPTDTLYGLGVDPSRRDALSRLYELKERDASKAIPVLVADIEQAESLVALTPLGRRLMERHWPGAMTIVCRRHRDAPLHVGDAMTDTVAVRAPDHPVAQAALRTCGPLAVTSANLAGGRPARSHDEATTMFGEAVALYLPGRAPLGVASTVVDATTEKLLVLRHGAIEVAG